LSFLLLVDARLRWVTIVLGACPGEDWPTARSRPWVDRRIFRSTMRAPSAQRDATLEFILLAAAEEGPRPFPEPVLDALRRVVPCDTVAFRAWSAEGSITDRSFAPHELADRLPVWSRYPRFRRDDPHPSEPASRSDPRPPVSPAERMALLLVLSDAADRRFAQTGLYFELMRPFGVRDVMKLFFGEHDGVGAAFVFDTSGSGFRENDRALLARLAPALFQLHRNARLRSEDLGADDRLKLLTARERTVLARVAAGETNPEIARALFIGASTVRKHLEHIYAKLEVRNRAAAATVYSHPVDP
jgi:DNA-binding CsgD family transcriptional regulator